MVQVIIKDTTNTIIISKQNEVDENRVCITIKDEYHDRSFNAFIEPLEAIEFSESLSDFVLKNYSKILPNE